MFGYIKTDYPYLYMKDNILYKAMYCGLCKGIGKSCGQKARFLLNYDLTFLSIFLHNVCGKDVEVKKQRCIAHHIVKRPVAIPDELTLRIASLNVILAYHKLSDNVIDNDNGRLKRAVFTSSYKKAKKKEPNLDKIVKDWYSKLLELEKKKIDSVDMASDPFGQMIVEVVKELTGDKFDENLSTLSYYLGKWIYLIDALDDFDKDKKKNNFNVFINAFPNVQTKEEFVKKHSQEIIYTFSEIISTIEECAKNVKYNFNNDLIYNILVMGIKQQTKLIMENKKCKNTTKH